MTAANLTHPHRVAAPCASTIRLELKWYASDHEGIDGEMNLSERKGKTWG